MHGTWYRDGVGRRAADTAAAPVSVPGTVRVCVLAVLLAQGCAIAPIAAPRVPPVHGGVAPPTADARFHDYRGVIHIHTTYSDGTGTFEEIGRIAQRQGLDFLITTDHNTLQPLVDGKEGWYPSTDASPRTLVLAGEEVSAPEAHVLAIGVTQSVDRDQSTQQIIDAIQRQGGLAFLAHPQYRRRPVTNWQVHDYTGLEVYNFVEDAERTPKLQQTVVGLLAHPDAFYHSMIRRPQQTLARWDALLAAGRHVVGIGAVDAHGVRLGRLRVVPYDVLFKTVRTHLLMPALSKPMILEALRAGHAYLSIDLLGDATGCVFRAEADGRAVGIMGDAVPLTPGLTLLIYAPTTAQWRLFKDGRLVETRRAQVWRYPVDAAGVYRVEADLHRQCWIIANPIDVRQAASP